MYDRGLWVLEQYGLTAKSSCKGRSVLLYETPEGWVSIREYGGTERKLEQQYELMNQIRESGFPWMDCLRKNLEGRLISYDREENAYVLREESATPVPSGILSGRCAGWPFYIESCAGRWRRNMYGNP